MKSSKRILMVLMASVEVAAAQTNVKPALMPQQSPQTNVAAPLPTTAAAAQTRLRVSPDPGKLTFSNLVQPTNDSGPKEVVDRHFELELDVASRQRHEKNPALAVQSLIKVLETNAPPEFKRKALFELALATQDNNELVKAQQIYAQYLQKYPQDPSVPEVLLRQGLLFRQMGVNNLAISKFYSVMSTALNLKLDNIEYYRNLVLQAQTEIADTYYLEGQFNEASEYYGKLLQGESPTLNRQQIEFRLVRSLSFLTNHQETITKSEQFLERYPHHADLPEVRFILASAYKAAERNAEALNQVMLLLQSQQDNARSNPEIWAYWQRRAGNEIANQLYKEADYLDALQIYQNLSALDPAPAWQAPALYQVGLVYEQLQQWQKASDAYGRIVARKSELMDSNAPPSLGSLCEMAQWRMDYIAWMQKARATNRELQQNNLYQPTSTHATAAQ